MMWGVAYSRIVGVIACLAVVLSQVGIADSMNCNPSQRFPYAPSHLAADWKEFATSLTPSQRKVLVAVLAGRDKLHAQGDGINNWTLYFALPGGVLTLWFGESGSPTGEFPGSMGRCSSTTTTTCRLAYPVLGSPDIQYFPSRRGGMEGSPPAGLRWYEISTEEFRPIDRIAKNAYAMYGVPSPWGKGIDFFEPSC